MKIKKVIVEIKPLKASLKAFAETYAAVKQGNKIRSRKGISFSDVESFRSFFSKKRLELLSVIKHKKPTSIYQLAQLTKRQYKNVHEDVNLLKNLGLISKDNNKIGIDFHKLCIELAV